MPEMISTATMINRLEGMLGTKDLSEWEETFVQSMVRARGTGSVTRLSERQIETLERLHNKHFA